MPSRLITFLEVVQFITDVKFYVSEYSRCFVAKGTNGVALIMPMNIASKLNNKNTLSEWKELGGSFDVEYYNILNNLYTGAHIATAEDTAPTTTNSRLRLLKIQAQAKLKLQQQRMR